MVFPPVAAALATFCTLVLRASGIKVSLALGTKGLAPASTSAFISDNGLVCKEGPTRTVESALALEKAGVKGGLYRKTIARTNLTCSGLGYTVPGGDDSCHPDVMLFFRDDAGPTAFREAEKAELELYCTRWGVQMHTVSLMALCSCHPDSLDLAKSKQSCEQLDGQVGSYIHRDPVTGGEITCSQGQVLFTTTTLAVLKSMAAIAMHQFDQIIPVECAVLGFTWVTNHYDDCFLNIHTWTATDPKNEDPGIKSGRYIEKMLYEGGFQMWVKAFNKTLDMDVFGSRGGCHCLPTSEVYNAKAATCDADKAAGRFSPVRDWWYGQTA